MYTKAIKLLVHKHKEWEDYTTWMQTFYYGILVVGGGVCGFHDNKFFCLECDKVAPTNVETIALLLYAKKIKAVLGEHKLPLEWKCNGRWRDD